jgi:hypothetical protein
MNEETNELKGWAVLVSVFAAVFLWMWLFPKETKPTSTEVNGVVTVRSIYEGCEKYEELPTNQVPARCYNFFVK